MKTVNIFLNENSIDQVKNLYPTQKEGLKQAVENYLIIRQGTINELKGRFNREELISIVDIHNATTYESRFTSPSILQAHIEDGELYESVCSRHGADLKGLIDKIQKLTHAQSLVLIEEAWRFWYGSEEGSKDLENFVSKFL